jgi:hypothetical protein
MKKPLIAIVGSVDETRQYDPPLRDPDGARKAAEALGTSLADGGYQLMVYSAEQGFIERDFVRGFVKSKKATDGSIFVLFPSGSPGAANFPERSKHERLFNVRQDTSSDWEIAFYRSLAQADGVVLVGGGRSTLIMGVLALTYRIPILTLAAYGGNAEKVWKSLAANRDLLAEDEIPDMAKSWSQDVVRKWMQSLEAQFRAKRAKRDESRGQSQTRPALVSLVLLCLWVLTLPLGRWFLSPGNGTSGGHVTAFSILLFVAPLLSGASGATIRMLRPEGGNVTLRATVLGVGAGAVASVLYVLGQLVGNPSPYNFVILAFSVAFGFIAGFTADSVFKKLEGMEALRTEVLAQRKG